ncbi:hypothetical protein SDC9_166345 [bioreactor metagenome]|uniref:Uncharacterized protein n=1 Tax=bioreactor metagenome TaxID=1076179 RepID=A0A645FZA9_9ZZZZ
MPAVQQQQTALQGLGPGDGYLIHALDGKALEADHIDAFGLGLRPDRRGIRLYLAALCQHCRVILLHHGVIRVHDALLLFPVLSLQAGIYQEITNQAHCKQHQKTDNNPKQLEIGISPMSVGHASSSFPCAAHKQTIRLQR